MKWLIFAIVLIGTLLALMSCAYVPAGYEPERIGQCLHKDARWGCDLFR